MDSESSQIHLFSYLINPICKKSEHSKRLRGSPSNIRVLYSLFQLHKNVIYKKWKDITPGKKRLSKISKVSRKTLTKFINSDEFKIFGTKTCRKFDTNSYELHKWVLKFFRFFEVKGMMKEFTSNFQRWKAIFIKRLKNWLVPLLDKGLSLKEILMNKPLTKQPLKGAHPKPLKGAPIKYYVAPMKHSHESKSNIELPIINSFVEAARKLRDRFMLREPDVNQVMKTYSINHHEKAIDLMELWKSRGMEIESPVRVYQHCLNKTKGKYV